MTKELEDLSNLHESQILKEKKHVFIFQLTLGVLFYWRGHEFYFVNFKAFFFFFFFFFKKITNLNTQDSMSLP